MLGSVSICLLEKWIDANMWKSYAILCRRMREKINDLKIFSKNVIILMLFLNICKVEASIVDQVHLIAHSCNVNMNESHCWPMFFGPTVLRFMWC